MIHGSYFTNHWNLPFHGRHGTCTACGHPTAEYGLHARCRACRSTVVTCPTVATDRARAVRRSLERRGILIGSRSVRYGLARVPHPGHTSLGVTQATWHRSAHSTSCRIEVTVKRGLPDLLFVAVVAHELAHAWLRSCDVKPSIVVEEGVAELTAFWLLGRVAGQHAAALQHRIATNRDRTYGRGFRMAMNAERRHGWPRVADTLIRTAALPR
jgi:hypothetical protein